MNDDQLTLQAIALRASERHGGVRGRALDRVAKKAGLTLSYTTVDRILAGTYTSTPSRNTLEALAVLAGVGEEIVFRAAGLPIPMGSFAEQLPPDADLLDGPQRDAVIAVVRQFVAAQRALHGREDVMGNAQHPAANTVPDGVKSSGGVTDLSDRRSTVRQSGPRVAKKRPAKRRGDDDLE